ncbi:M1 family metallopeptidase [Massilia agri]|uniref:Aminopeptidase n=1 Tax=Massilia agri TaxID=1886785 RepID=A0ABT2APY3_9BURK|nr:M1 family metallopeptidase [Massilia agri]MCS0597783.1 M1 family metallopeptidase [Massilia agri]
MPVARAAAAVAFALTTAGAQAEAPYAFATTPGKLPKDVIPLQYSAHIMPDVAGNSFRGTQTVEIEVLKTTSLIMLNADNLEIDAASLSGKEIGKLALKPILDRGQQTLRFELARPLAPGKYALDLTFKGQINREGRGLFYVNYKADGAEKKLIATTMAPTDARRMLPTWDEPSFRARFKLTVDVPSNFKTYSTTPIEKQEPLSKGMQRVTFGNTPKMPSYLVVLVAGEMERVAAKQDGVEIGVVTTEGKGASTAFPLQASRDLLRYFNHYFGIPYPLPKLDQIAIPGGFNGAMENWGAVVYNEPTLLYDPKKSPDRVKKFTFNINAHELAHQWFGNLVTMAWWDNLWLNEGFASWMAAKATQHFHPEWRPYLDEIAAREYVMNLDARKTTHPIQTRIDTEEQAAAAFDAITYSKGQAFLRMLEAYLGEDNFRKGIRAYMARHQYSNTTSADLWAALEKASGKPVGKLASDWTTQPGFPLIKVEQACEEGKRKITLSQEQYRLDEPASEKRLWNVPLQVGTVNGKAWTTLLSGPSTTITQASCEGALVVDPYSVGYFRVHYDPASFHALAEQAPRLLDSTRLRLLADSWSLALAGRMPLDAYLDLVRKYANEPRPAVWEALLSHLRTVSSLLSGEPEQALVRRFFIDLARPRLAALGWDEKPGESLDDAQLRGMLATSLARAGDPEAIAQGKARFARFLADPSSVPPSMIDFVTLTAGRYADAATYEALAARAANAPNSEERNRFGKALTSALDPQLAARTLQMLLSPQTPPDLIPYIIGGVSAEHLDQTWNFAVANRDALLNSMEALGRHALFASIVSSSANPVHAELVENYMRKNFGADGVVEAERAGNGVRIRAAQKARLLPQVRAALQKQ